MAVLIINGMDMPSPQTMEISWREIGKKETNAMGQMVMDRVALKRDIKCVWRYLSVDDARVLFGIVNAEPFFSLACVDPVTGENVVGEYKAEDRLIKPARYAEGKPVGFSDVQITFQER